MKTIAAILIELNRPLELVELEIPPLQNGQVLVQMVYSGLCHTQLNEWKGKKGADPYLPHTLGHEGSGIVLEIGEGVTKVKPGDRVVLSWIKGRGLDVLGASYQWEGRKVNSGAISTFMEKAVIAESRVIPIPDTIPFREASLLGCAIPTGAGVVLNDMQLKAGQSVAVFGIGGIGLSALIAARSLNAYPIIAVDVVQEKLERSKRAGATHALHANESGMMEKLFAITQGKGLDFALECAGRKEVMETAFSCVKAPGGLCVLAGNLAKGEKIQIDPFDLIRGRRILGTWGGGTQLDEDVPRYIDLFFKERNSLDILISDEVPLGEINDLMARLDQGKIARGLIALNLPVSIHKKVDLASYV